MGFWQSLKKRFSSGEPAKAQSSHNARYGGENAREFTNPLYSTDNATEQTLQMEPESPEFSEVEYEEAPEPENPAVLSEPEYEETEEVAAPDQAPAPADTEDHAELAQLKGRAPLRELQELLDHSQKGGVHSSAANSDAFNAVTNTITSINTRMDLHKFGGEIGDDVHLLINMEEQYAALLQNCDLYLGHHSVSKAGRARKELVRKIRSLAQQDIQGLHLASDQIGRASQADRASMSWDDLLQKARTVKITINTSFVGSEKALGGAVSDVKKLKSENAQTVGANGETKALEGLKFFKPQDVVNPEEDAVAVAVRKVLADYPATKPAVRAVLSRIVYDTDTVDFMDPETGDLPYIPRVMKDKLNSYYISYNSMKDQLLAPSGLTSIGQIEMSGRNVATSRLADLLGVGNLIARSELAEVTDSEGTTRKGIIMDAAKGMELKDLEDMSKSNGTKGDYAASGKNLVAPSFLRDITSLQALDILCGQMDRHANNMHYQTDDAGRLTGVMGIDNDASFGTNENAISLERGGDRFDRAVYDDDSNLVIPHLDQAFADHVMALSESTVTFAMRDLIGEKETKAVLARLDKLKKAIGHARPGQLLQKEEDWDGTVQKEMLDACNITEEERRTRNQYDAVDEVRLRYGVDNPNDLPAGPQREAAWQFKDAMTAKQSHMLNKTLNRGSNYVGVLERF